ncbi:MAG: DUF11 domain-containing protein [Burkholderiaceae bacterium]|nr:DUF11 domain-containing protein [Burkholderiaceae bacterium]
MAEQNIYLYATQSPPASVDTGEGDFPYAPGVALSDGTIFYTWRDDPLKTDSSGTGIFDPFLTIQKSGSETGSNLYNGSTYATGNAISSSDNRTSLLEISKIPVVGIGGMEYLEIRLDLNEVSGGGGPKAEVRMTDLKIYGSNNPGLSSFSGLTPLYSIDQADLDTTVHMWDDYNGSGRSDVVMLIPKTFFVSNPQYLYFQSTFQGTDGGFEEFSTQILQAPLDPSITIEKTADVLNADRSDDTDDIIDTAGDIVSFTVLATNVGDVALTNPTITDPLIAESLDINDDGLVNAEDIVGGDDNANGLMDVGETWVWQGEYTVTQDDMNLRGNYDGPDEDSINDNVIRNEVAILTDEGASADNFADADLDYRPLHSLQKTFDVLNADRSDDTDDIIDEAGDIVQYSLSVKNDGNITLRDVVIDDPLIADSLDTNDDGVVDVLDSTGGDDGNGLLDVGETWTFAGEYSVTQADMDARGNYDELADGTNDNVIRNAANAIASTLDQTLDATARAYTDLDYRPIITVEKVDDVINSDRTDDTDDIVDEAGDIISYSVEVKNLGNITLSNVVVTDPLIADSLDINDDGVVDVLDATGGDDNANGQLDVGETWTFAGEYTVTQADMDARGNYDELEDGTNDNVIRNAVSVSAKTQDQTLDATNRTYTELDYRPLISIEKTPDVLNADRTDDPDDEIDSAGDIITYAIAVKNEGNITLTDVVLTDALIADSLDTNDDGVINVLDAAGGDSNTNGLLDVGETWTFAGEYAVTQADIDNHGNHDSIDPDTINDNVMRNVAAVTSKAGDQNISDDTIADSRVIYSPELVVTKTANVSQVDEAGDEIVYTVTVENRGNVTLTNVVVADPLSGLDETIASLAPGGSQSFDVSYYATQEEFDTNGGGDGDIDNTATADSNETDAVTASYEVELLRSPELWIGKTANVSQVDEAGDEIVYTVTVENRGNVTLTNVVVTDPLSGLDQTIASLAPGGSQSFDVSYYATQEEFDTNGGGDGDIDNTATADSDQTGQVQDSHEVGIVYDPAMSVLKMANVDTVDEVGDMIHYTIEVSNTGNITLTNVTLQDTLIEDSLDNDMNDDGVIDGDDGDGLLEVGETWTWQGDYTVTQADMDAAMASMGDYYIRNTATGDSDETDPETSSEEVSLVKVAFEGLSPGYWKNHPEDWDGLSSAASFETFFFGGPKPGLNWKVKTTANGKDKFAASQDITMEQALALTGGGEAALARQAVAAVLNSRDEDVTYRFTESQIKEWVSEALSGQPVDLENDGVIEFAAGTAAIEGVKNLLDFNNNLELI